jgi:AcrR family transcriptional regulator
MGGTTAKMCLVEVYAAGPEAVVLMGRMFDGLEQLATRMFARIPGREGMPPEIVRAIVGGVQKVVHKRLLRDEAEALPRLAPALWEWVVSVPPPPGPLLPRQRQSLRPRRFAERQASSNPAERVLRAMAAVVAERGYADTSVAAVVERARTSQRTFYDLFANKEEAMEAALDSGSAQMLAALLPAFRRSADWQHSVRETLGAMFRFAAEEPEYGRLGAVEMYAAGKRALEQRERVSEEIEELLGAGLELSLNAPEMAPEAIGGALNAMLYDFVKANGPGRLLELVPAATYVSLAPFVSAAEAYEIAVG